MKKREGQKIFKWKKNKLLEVKQIERNQKATEGNHSDNKPKAGKIFPRPEGISQPLTGNPPSWSVSLCKETAVGRDEMSCVLETKDEGERRKQGRKDPLKKKKLWIEIEKAIKIEKLPFYLVLKESWRRKILIFSEHYKKKKTNEKNWNFS